ncbi:sel1 repeat family protein [Thalassotalea euphylliae]|uniref:Sel1 repeat family protein n=1 Tax=Thalassotalea euphylliae TaxID=1655234 RepID=A0A3E0UEM9_9GAMM|nr:sel1 repeat family protein [Thalassotalea euphylliae]REL35310.1 sel1 repeat family protein [Thalassotalea euphylliae]
MSDNFKAPSQVFRWFEKMKANYEHTVNSVLNKFEAYNEKQQERIDANHQDHLESLKHLHKEQQIQSQATIAQLQADVNYFKQQVSQQQHTIEQLNARYDAVMTTFLEQKKRDIDIKAIFDNGEEEAPIELTSPLETQRHTNVQPPREAIQQAQPTAEFEPEQRSSATNPVKLSADITDDITDDFTNESPDDLLGNSANATTEETNNEHQKALSTKAPESDHTLESLAPIELVESAEPDEALADKLYNEAMANRDSQEFEQAIALFKEAAKFGCVKSRGAIGRAYFLAEGVEEDQTLGLAWLISAADLGLPQAIKRVEYFQESDPELYIEASTLIGNA